MANEQNLQAPWKPGQSGNPKGKPKGLQSWATVVKELLEDDKLADKLLAKKPNWWASLPTKNGGNAIVIAMMIQAMGGDVKAATWLRRTGYGDKLELVGDEDSFIPIPIFNMRTGVEMMVVPKPQPKPKAIPAKIVKPKKKPAPKKPKAK